MILSLTGCGQAAKLPETVENTSLVVEKDGKVTSYLVNTFDKDFYNLDGLTQMVEEEAEEFNVTHAEATENPMNVKTVQALGDGAMLDKALEKNHLIITNASAYIYCPYPVLYISEGVVMGEDGYVDASQSDGVVTILMKK